MSFSAATCITYNELPSSPQVTGFTIFYDSGHSEVLISDVPLSQLTAPNCPYIITDITDGTEFLYFKDNNNYCFTISVQDNDICSSCNLGLAKYSASTITRVSSGLLTGSCQTTISDYLINWYGPDDTTTLAFTSGLGNIFTYEHQHPFLNNNSVPQPEGVYTPIIQKIILNGITFSNTGESETVLVDLNNCLPSTTVLPMSCSNQTNTTGYLPQYKHFIKYEFTGSNLPVPVQMTYKVSASTDFFAWKFSAATNPDRITIEFSGSSYSNKFLLEDFVVGGNLTTSNFNVTTFPKSASTSYYFTKLTCLTGFTVTNNDNILITVTPSSTETIWALYSTCLTNYDCSSCMFTNPYKIIGSTISGFTTDNCSTKVKFSISGCNITEYYNSDLYKYYLDQNSVFGSFQYPTYTVDYSDITMNYPYVNPINYVSNDLFTNKNICTEAQLYSIVTTCSGDTNDVIYEKTFVGGIGSKGIFNVTGSSTVISAYYDSWNYMLTNFSGSSSNTDVNYYRKFWMKMPSNNTSDNCNESPTSRTMIIHPSSKILTGNTGSSYYFRLTAETISNNFSAVTNCDINCLSKTNSFVNSINEMSTGTTPSQGYYYKKFTYDPSSLKYGVFYTKPFHFVQAVSQSTNSRLSNSIGGILYTNEWTTNTIPFSGVSNTLIPSFSGTVCNYNTLGKLTTSFNSNYNLDYFYNYFVVKKTETDFEIWASPIVNFSANTSFNSAILAYRYSGGTVTTSNPTYII